jgi:enoyl-CoA hydratase
MSYDPTPHVLIERDGPVAIVTLNNPDMRNAFLDDMHRAMQDIWLHLGEDAGVKAVVLTGAGKAFSAGGHVPNFILDYEDTHRRGLSLRGARRLMDEMAAFPKPLVAAVNGPAIGLGCSVAVSCDIVYIAESAYMADPHVSVGLVCGDGGAATWPLMMGLLKAKEYLLTGDRMSSEECVSLGLANRCFPDDELLPAALAFAHRLASQPSQAVQETKRAINLHVQSALALVMPFAIAAEAESFGTDDLRRTIENFKKS